MKRGNDAVDCVEPSMLFGRSEAELSSANLPYETRADYVSVSDVTVSWSIIPIHYDQRIVDTECRLRDVIDTSHFFASNLCGK
jgi:hypothetical protein